MRHIELADEDVLGQLELIDIPAEAAAPEPWFNETLASVNDAVVRLGVIDGDFHWHKHDEEDEFFLVLDGELLVDIEDADTITLGQHQACTVPKGVVHRTARHDEPRSSWSRRPASSPSATELNPIGPGRSCCGRILRRRYR